MKIILTILILLPILVCVYFAYLSMNEKAPDTALLEGKLRACPNTPNCVSSETTGEKFIEPLKPADSSDLETLWAKLPEDGQIVVSAVMEKTKSQLLNFYTKRSVAEDSQSETLQVAVNKSRTLGGQLAYNPALSVSLFSFIKNTTQKQ